MQQVRIGQTLTYNDGRPGHRNVRATVIAVKPNGFVAQFEDRADTTLINWDQPNWIDHITFET